MPTLTDIMDEVKQIGSGLSARVDLIDKEQKALGEALTSKTGEMPAEYKAGMERMQKDIDALLEKVEQARIEEARPKLATKRQEKSKEHQAFMKAMRLQADVNLLSEKEKELIVHRYMPEGRKALYAGDAVTGGFFAAQDFIDELLEYRLLISNMRKLCRIQPTSGESVKMPSLQDDASAYMATEQSSYTDSTDPTVHMLNIPVHEARGKLKVSEQNLEDSMFDLEGLIKERLMLKFAQLEGKKFLQGTGTGEPRGLRNYPTKASSGYSGGSAGKNNVTDAIPYVLSGAATGKINADDVLGIIGDLKEDYEPNVSYVLTRGSLWTIRMFKDSMSRPLWQPFGAGDLPGTIYGRPYATMPDMDEIATGTYPLLVGDFKYYMIVDRLTMNMRKLEELYAEQGLIGFIARIRFGGDCLMPEAFRFLKCN
jgi:HK97 family phage major capsid protein